jgi:hypothetical protein
MCSVPKSCSALIPISPISDRRSAAPLRQLTEAISRLRLKGLAKLQGITETLSLVFPLIAFCPGRSFVGWLNDLSAGVSASVRRPEPRAMKWQSNGELAGSDLHALLSHLKQVESEERVRELQWLGRHAAEA